MYYSVLWVADYQTLRTTNQEKKLGQDSLSKAYIKKKISRYKQCNVLIILNIIL